MRFFKRDKPKIKVETTKADGFSGWLKCTHCHEMIHVSELSKNLNCCPRCDYHYRVSAQERIEMISDQGSFHEMFSDLRPLDPLGFVDTESYENRLKKAASSSGSSEAVVVGECLLEGQKVALAVLDFSFMAGSMGSVVGEKLTLIIEHALRQRLALIIFSSSGGARMQESIFSLMQMAKTAGALSKLHEAKIPFISVITNPTLGGVTASFASLGDLIIAEPDALIGFAGPRVVEQTTRQKLPPGAQKSEFLLEHGMIDVIVKRAELKKNLSQFVWFLSDNARENASLEEPSLYLESTAAAR